MLGLKEKEYIVLLGEDSRIRHYHSRMGQQIIEFMIQLEIDVNGAWKPVVRYDTAHGFAHRDIIHPQGEVDKTPVAMGDYNAALSFAELDLRSNWEMYRERFLKEEEKK